MRCDKNNLMTFIASALSQVNSFRTAFAAAPTQLGKTIGRNLLGVAIRATNRQKSSCFFCIVCLGMEKNPGSIKQTYLFT